MDTNTQLILPILVPLIAGVLIFILPKRLSAICALFGTIGTFAVTILLYNKEMVFVKQWAGNWAGIAMDFVLRLYHFSSFITLAASFFALLIVIYALSFQRNSVKQFYGYILVSLGFVNGAVLADSLVVLLFFWEGLLLTVFGLIAIGGKQAIRTAIKAFVIGGICDLCMMAGIVLTIYLAGTTEISKISLHINSLGGLAFVLLAIGAIGKAGSMPFHTWIPDAAIDAPLPFMGFFPGSIEKLVGIYFLTRITMDMFKLSEESVLSTVLMIVGGATIIFAVMMALVQKDYKKLLSYHAISQVGYMILGVGTCLPAGIIGGLFHMLNNAIYKNCLFLTGGSVEKATGTTDLHKLGGLGKQMPVTFLCFIITAASISGVPPFNGFFSKELIYEAAKERGAIFYVIALLGSFFTAASFLKLGHAAYISRPAVERRPVKESPISMLIPMIVLAVICVIFGVFNFLPINNFLTPIIGEHAQGHHFAGFPENATLTIITCLVLLAAFVHHVAAARIMGGGPKAAEHIHHAPLLSTIYNWAEKKYLDPYEIVLKIIDGLSFVLWKLDRAVDWVYDSLSVGIANLFSMSIRKAHTGYYAVYVAWCLIGAALIIFFIF